MRTEDIEQFDEELWNIVKSGMLGPLIRPFRNYGLVTKLLLSLNKVEF